MGSETEQIREEIEARREELSQTIQEIGNRVDVSRATFIAGIFTGILLLALLNRILFHRLKK